MRLLLKCLTFSIVSLSTFGQHQRLKEIIDDHLPVPLVQASIDSLIITLQKESSEKELADLYHDVALHWHYQNWNKYSEIHHLDRAIESTEKAISLKSKLDSLDIYSLKRSYYNLGILNFYRGDIYTAIDSHLKVVDLGAKDDRTMAAFDYLSTFYKIIGDFQRSIESSRNSISVIKIIGGNDYQQVNSHISLAETFFQMGPLQYSDEIESNLNKADSIIKVGTNVSALEKARVAHQRGNLALMLGEHATAIKYHKSVLDLKNLIAPFYYTSDELNMNLALVYNSLGVSYDKIGDSTNAIKHLKKAISLNPASSLPYENIGDLYTDRNQYKKGLFNYQKAIVLATLGDTVVKDDTFQSIEELQLSTNKTFLLRHLVAKANAWLAYYKYDNNNDHLTHALTTFELADQLIDIIRSQSTEYQTQLYWREQSANLYMKAVETCYLLEDPVKAYYFMERNKALLLLEEISQEKAKEISRLPDSIAKQEFELKREIHLAENTLSNTENAEESNRLKDSIFRYKRNYDLFLESLERSYPDYARLKTQLKILEYEDFISEYVNDQQSVLQYILNEEQGYGILHGLEGSFFFKLEDATDLNRNLDKLNRYFADFQFNEADNQEYQKLSQLVLQSLLPENGLDMISGKTILAVPDYLLQRIPLEALLTQTEPLRYLVEDTEVAYIYSVSYLHSKKSLDQVAEKEIVSVAPVTFERQNLAKLGFSLAEVEGIKDIFGGEILKEDDATKSKFLELMDTFRILHLSTHADIDANGNHWVAFRDEKLHLNEIYAHRNEAEMVVLSACNTSRGDLKKGEGVMSLARAFFNSGAKSVVSSLWPVQDKAGKEIMVEFYQGLDRGLTKSAALRQAKLTYLRNNEQRLSHPSYWASLIVIGDNSAIKNTSAIFDYWPGLLMLLGIAVILIIIYRKADFGRSKPS